MGGGGGVRATRRAARSPATAAAAASGGVVGVRGGVTTLRPPRAAGGDGARRRAWVMGGDWGRPTEPSRIAHGSVTSRRVTRWERGVVVGPTAQREKKKWTPPVGPIYDGLWKL